MSKKLKRQNHAPYYAFLFPVLSDIARKHGYALAMHGSVGRDLDVIAAPWIREAESPEALAKEIYSYAALIGGYRRGVRKMECTRQPHGRKSYAIHLGCGAYLDLSIMPRK